MIKTVAKKKKNNRFEKTMPTKAKTLLSKIYKEHGSRFGNNYNHKSVMLLK